MCASSNHRASFVRSLSAIHLDPIVNQRSLSPSSSCDSSQKSSTKQGRAVTPPSPTNEPPSNQKHKAQHEETNKFKTKSQPKKQSTSTGRRRRSSATSLPYSSSSVTKGFRADYEIGESIRSLHHMLTHSSPEQATRASDSLQKHDFAFIKRRDGSYTYAILAKRTENSLTFVVCKDGYVKKVGKENWNELVCSVAMQRYRSVDHGLVF